MVDPLKVEAIVQLPPTCTIPRLQSLQGKENFLQRFIVNYVNITKGFMCLLKKDVPFHWDEVAQHSFEALKHALTSTPLLRPSNYNKDHQYGLGWPLQSQPSVWSCFVRMICSHNM
jgi:hypothetical protein